MSHQEFITLGEMAGAEEALMSGQRRRVDGLQNQVIGVSDECFFAACVTAPKQKYDGLFVVVELLDDCVGEFGPADFAMAICLTAAYGEGSVEHEHTFFCPRNQAAGVRSGQSHIALQFFKDVLQAGWGSDTWTY